MFTGIIAAVGQVAAVEEIGRGERGLSVKTPFNDAVLGESIAVNGVCLTVAECMESREEATQTSTLLRFHASPETLERTNLGALKPGSTVNLERALRLSDRLSGHLVQGHVDGTATLAAVAVVGECQELTVMLPREFLRYVISKGSIALDGISLTVNSIDGDQIKLMIIPHTWKHTTLASKRAGEPFNVELDMVAKYLERQRQVGP